MKKSALKILTALAIVATAQAGEEYSAKAAPVVAPAPCLWTWFAGASGGYIDDIDNEMWTIHLGKEYKCPGSESSHAIFLEVGWTDWTEGDIYQRTHRYEGSAFSYDRYDIDLDFSVIPITINYKYENQLVSRLNWYIGGGLGIAISTIDIDFPRFLNDYDESETNFFAQASTGLVWNISDSFEIFGGVRYLYMDGNDDVDGHEIPGILDNDFFYELGLRFNF